jgi:hypothetical protein
LSLSSASLPSAASILNSLGDSEDNMAIPKIYWKLFTFAFGIYAFSRFVFLGFIFLPSRCYSWCIGDWLINYQGGIVRRGLTGELFFSLSKITGINQITLIILFQIFLYGIFLFNSCRLATNSSFSVLNIALFLSPAFILFPILNPAGSFRKEILLFAFLSSVCSYLLFRAKISKFFLIFLGFSSMFVALSHEMLIVYLPYLVIATLFHEKGLGSKTKGVIIAIVPAIIIGLLISILAGGNKQIVIDVCNSLGINAPSKCVRAGAIAFLGRNLSYAHELVLRATRGNTRIVYILLTVLSFAPISFILAFEKSKIVPNKEVRFWPYIILFMPISGSILLLWVFADYGRIIYINTVCVSLLILMANPDRSNTPLFINLKSIIALILCLAFITSWRLIYYKASVEKAFPLINYLKHLHN